MLSQLTRGRVPGEHGERDPASSSPFPTCPTGDGIKGFGLSGETGCRLVLERLLVGKAGGHSPQGAVFGADGQISHHRVAPDTGTLLGWEWVCVTLMRVNKAKCKVLHLGRCNP